MYLMNKGFASLRETSSRLLWTEFAIRDLGRGRIVLNKVVGWKSRALVGVGNGACFR
jgi:hypothetical protein